MLPPVHQTADICTNLMIGDGFDSAAGAQIHPTGPLDLHGSFFELLFEIFPGLEVVFNQLEYCTTGSICNLGGTKLGEKLVM